MGGVGLTGDKDTPAYALTDKNGTVTKDSATADNYNIMWDGETLTLRNATISGGNVFDSDKSAAIYYIQESPLNLMLVGDNAVTGPSGEGIEKSYGISACGTDDYIDLTISGAGTLTATGGDVSSGTIRTATASTETTLSLRAAQSQPPAAMPLNSASESAPWALPSPAAQSRQRVLRPR